MRELFDLIQPSRLMSIVDIGANPEDGGAPPYARMIDEGMCTVTAIDPKGPAISHPNVRTLRHVIGDGTEQTLNVCAAPGMTGLLRLSPVRASLFPQMTEWGAVQSTETVKTTRFDDVEGVVCDFLKMDIQGSERDVLAYGREQLSRCVAIMTEMSFVPLYQGQWTFGRMDTELRQMGFIPHCFVEAKVWPLTTQFPVPNLSPHQLLECDMIYIRDVTASMSAEMWKHLAMVAHHVCGSFDLAMRCVSELARMDAVSPSAPEQYRQMLERM